MLAKGSKLSAKVRVALSKPGAEKKNTYLALLTGNVERNGFTAKQGLRVGEHGVAEVQARSSDGGSGLNRDAESNSAQDAGDGKINGYKPACTKGTCCISGNTEVTTLFYLSAGECCPYIAIHKTDTLFYLSQVSPLCAGTSEDGTVTTLAVCSLIQSGRFHQIRAHCAHNGHVIVGDVAYGTSGRGSNPAGGVGGVVSFLGGIDPSIDDAENMLRNMHDARFAAGCSASRALRSEIGVTGDSTLKSPVTLCEKKPPKQVGHYICLHAFEYEFTHHGRHYQVRTKTIPEWARKALSSDGWPDESITPENIAAKVGAALLSSA